jgi:carbonic anhydrase/acetyltransferase-like protein (isoleucine patch superfamily)
MVILPLPLPRTEQVLTFTKLAGTEHYDSNIILAGCYIIRSSNLEYSATTELSNECYIGQTTHLGHRIKVHAKKVDSTTRLFIESLKNQGIVELCIIPEDIIIPSGLT